MKLIALPDIHGRPDHLHHIGEQLKTADWVLLVGDITNGSLSELATVLDVVRQYNANILAIPGNMDTNFINKRLTEHGINVHGGHRVIDGLAFLGVGGALPFFGTFVFEEPQLASILNATLIQLPPDIPRILICHQPPYDTLNDRLGNGQHVGSHAVRDFIEKQQPLICFTGHIHEAIGIDSLGVTQIVNPGRRGYAFAEIADGVVKTLNFHPIPRE
jgi:uncharacterized protein